MKTGLRYSDVRAAADALGVEWCEETLEGLLVCESVILKQQYDRMAEEQARQDAANNGR